MKICNNTCDTDTCFLCKNCHPEWLPAIDIHRKNFEIKKGEHIFTEGNLVTGIYFIYKGNVKVHKKWDDEKDLIIRFAKTGDILGHLGLGDNSVYPVSATALGPLLVCYLEMSFFEKTLTVNANFTYKLMRFFANELQESEKRMQNLAHMSVKARIAQALLALKKQFGTNESNSIGIEITRQDISSYAGVSYETLFKVIQELTRLNIIKSNGKSISIIDQEQLVNIIQHDNK